MSIKPTNTLIPGRRITSVEAGVSALLIVLSIQQWRVLSISLSIHNDMPHNLDRLPFRTHYTVNP